METEFKIGDFVKTPLGIIMEIYELFDYQGEQRATGRFCEFRKWKFLTYPTNRLKMSEWQTHSRPKDPFTYLQ